MDRNTQLIFLKKKLIWKNRLFQIKFQQNQTQKSWILPD